MFIKTNKQKTHCFSNSKSKAQYNCAWMSFRRVPLLLSMTCGFHLRWSKVKSTVTSDSDCLGGTETFSYEYIS